MKLLECWQHYVLKKIAKRNTSQGNFSGYTKLKEVFIFFVYSPEAEQKVLRYAQKLGDEGKFVSTLAYYPRKRKEAEKTNVPLLCKDELNWYKRPKAAFEKAYAEKNYDLFVQLGNKSSMVSSFVEGQVSADFSCGTQVSPYQEYDLIIDMEQKTVETYFKELDYYLHFINNQI